MGTFAHGRVVPPRFGDVIATAPFGRTGHASTRVIFGAAALGSLRQERADAILQQLLDAGINHLDTAAMYGDSELRIGPWMAEHRDRFFLATKTGQRRGDDARAELERSLERLQVDSVDLIQLHNLVEPEEWEIAHGPGGAIEALAAGARRGARAPHRRHRPRHPHRADAPAQPGGVPVRVGAPAVQLRRRCRTTRTGPTSRSCSAVCADREVAVQTIKAIGRRRWPEDHEGRRFSWYQPITDEAAIGRAARWVLSHDQLFLNTSSDATLLPIVLATAAAARIRSRPRPSCRPTSTPTTSSRSSTARPSSGSERASRIGRWPTSSSDRALNRATLARQLLLERSDLDAGGRRRAPRRAAGPEPARPLPGAVVAAGRLRSRTPSGALLEARQLVRIVVMRGTIHLVTAADALFLRPLMQPVLDAEIARHSEYAPLLDGLDLAPVMAYARPAARRDAAWPGRRSAPRWPSGSPSSPPPPSPTPAAASSRSCRCRPAACGAGSSRSRPRPLDAWVGQPLRADASIDDAVLRYLAAFGPATVADVAAWSRLTGLKEVVERLRPRLRAFTGADGP